MYIAGILPTNRTQTLSNLNNNFDSLFQPVTNLVIQGPSWHSFFQTGDVLLEPCWSYSSPPGPAKVKGPFGCLQNKIFTDLNIARIK